MHSGIKKRLAEKRLMSPLFDSDRLRGHLEEAYKVMWARYEAADPPWSFDIEASPKLPALRPPAPPPASPPPVVSPNGAPRSGTSDDAAAPPPSAPVLPPNRSE
jgi:hypothetical protein